jgi:hypothetical protein
MDGCWIRSAFAGVYIFASFDFLRIAKFFQLFIFKRNFNFNVMILGYDLRPLESTYLRHCCICRTFVCMIHRNSWFICNLNRQYVEPVRYLI